MNSSQTTKYHLINNLDSKQITQLISLSFLTDKILKSFDEGLLTKVTLIDLQKAFETINHKILLKKFEAIGFSDQCIRWFRSYLCERIFFVEIENQLSDRVVYRRLLI